MNVIKAHLTGLVLELLLARPAPHNYKGDMILVLQKGGTLQNMFQVLGVADIACKESYEASIQPETFPEAVIRV